MQHENELAGSPLIPRQSETRLRLSEAGFVFQGLFLSGALESVLEDEQAEGRPRGAGGDRHDHGEPRETE